MSAPTAVSPLPSQTMAVDEFRAGVTACLRSWSALRAAVEGGWGGAESHAKAEDLRAYIFQHFDFRACPPKTLTVDDLEDHLAIYLEEEFSVVLEDSSERQVADAIWKMYEDCYRGDSSLSRQMVATAESVISLSAAYPSQLQSTEHDEAEDEDEHMIDAEQDSPESSEPTTRFVSAARTPMSMSAHEYATQSLFGVIEKKRRPVSEETVRQLGESIPEEPPIEVDEDGFAPVQAKSRPTGRKPL